MTFQDLEDDRQVSKDQASALAEQFGWKFLEASAKAKINVTETFMEVVRSIRIHRSGEEAESHSEEGNASKKKPSKSGGRRSFCMLL